MNEQSFFEQEDLWGQTPERYQNEVKTDLMDILPSDIRSILDVGCGDGFITNALSGQVSVIGLDISRTALKFVSRDRIQGSVLDIPLKDGACDLVMANDILEHFEPSVKVQALHELARVSAKYVIITVPIFEDLNVGMAKCAVCGKYFHINHHVVSFTPKETKKLLDGEGFHCIRQIVTGDQWNPQASGAVFAKKLMLIDLTQSNNSVCPFCGATQTVPSQEPFPVIERIGSENCTKEQSDACYFRRTECINLFSRSDLQPENVPPGFINDKGQKIKLPSISQKHQHISFTREVLFRKQFLPKYSFLPYYVCEEVSHKGVRLSVGKRLCFGFFYYPGENENVILNLSGTTKNNCTLLVSQYKDNFGYLTPKKIEVAGNFSIKISFTENVISEFGMLFELRVEGGDVILKSAELSCSSDRTIQIFHNKGGIAKYWRSLDQNIIDLSLHLFDEYFVDQVLLSNLKPDKPDFFPVLSESNFSSLSTILQVLRSIDVTLGKEKDALSARYETLQNEKTRISEESLNLRNEKDALSTRCEALRNEEARISEELLSLRNEKNALSTRYEALRNEEARISEESCSLRNEKDALSARYETLRNEKDALDARYEALQNEKVRISEEYQNLNNVKDTLTACYEILQGEKARLYEEYATLRTSNEKLGLMYTTLQEEKALLHEEYAKLGLMYATLQEEKAEAERSSETMKNSYLKIIKKQESFVQQMKLQEKMKKNSLKNRIINFFKKIGKGKFENDTSLRYRVLRQSEPTRLPVKNHHKDPSQKKFLMICHDQNIDRRIIQEAKILQNMGWTGTIIALSFDNNDAFDEIDGLFIHRIGLAHVVPDCPTYWRYQNRMRWINWWGRNINLLHKNNWIVYGFDRVMKYQNISAFAPLPFDYAFYNAGKHYPSDLVEAHDLPALKTASQLSEKWGVPLIYDAHELYYEQNVFSRVQKRMMRNLEQEYIHKCSATFTVNESIAQEMSQRYHCTKPYVLVNAIDQPAGFNPVEKQNRIREHFSIPQSSPVILYQGGLSFLRNLENLAVSMRHIKNPDAVLVFMGDGQARETLGKIVEKYHLTTRVFFKEAVPQSELLSWTASADLGIIPYPPVDLNSYLCTPNKLFEYMQAGLPMVANDLPELRRFVKDTGFGWTAPLTTPKEIARALDAALSHPERLQEIRTTLLRQNAKYTWTSMSRIYVSVINDVMKTRDSNSGAQ